MIGSYCFGKIFEVELIRNEGSSPRITRIDTDYNGCAIGQG